MCCFVQLVGQTECERMRHIVVHSSSSLMLYVGHCFIWFHAVFHLDSFPFNQYLKLIENSSAANRIEIVDL